MPTKELFIEMLTRDISLEDAIIDLIDNSIDAAKKDINNQNYADKWVKISISKEKFSISDNCGGMTKLIAINYAFRFGRPNTWDTGIKHTVGRFGIGMKRSIFKIGKDFQFISNTENERFMIEENIEKWKKNDQWNFQIHDLNKDIKEENGIELTIHNLYTNVEEEFNDQVFINNLIKEIEKVLSIPILQNFSIYINDDILSGEEINFLNGDDLKPFYKEIRSDDAIVKIFVGIGEPNPKKAGWYIYCNDRLMLEADKSTLTGWKEQGIDDELSIVQYHNQYAMFRGVVFFDSDDPFLIPMTTTKTGIDENHRLFKGIRREMNRAMKLVISFLKSISNKDERDEFVNNYDTISLSNIKFRDFDDKFISPDFKSSSNNGYLFTTISFKKEKKIVSQLKDDYNLSNNKELGEFLFDYFLKMEGFNE